MDRNANRQDHAEASLKDMKWPWTVPLEEAAFSCRDAVCNFKGKKRWSKKEGKVVTVQRSGRKWKYDETCDSINLGHCHTGGES